MRHGRVSAITTALLILPAVSVLLAADQRGAKHTHYKALDLGTFGGPESYINPASVFGSPTQISERGTAVGGSAMSIPTTPASNFIICGGPAGGPFVNHAFEWRNDVVADLGTLAGAENCSVATSINAGGQVVGTSENGVLDPITGITQIRAVLWVNGQVQDLGTLGGNHSLATGNNDRGQVVGLALNAIADPFNSFGTQARAFLWQNGQMRDLGTLGGPDAAAFALNDRGHVAGGSYTDSTPNPATGIPTQDPYFWKDGKMTDLGTLGGTFGSASALNNRDQVIGASNLAGDQAADPFLWDRGTLIDLYTETTGGHFLTANALNDAGRVVGAADFSSTGGSQFGAALWRNGEAINLGTLSGDCFGEAIAINSEGQVVGNLDSCESGGQRAFLWENGTMIDLNSKTPPGFPLVLANAVAINERGEIGGFGLPAGCDEADTCGHAFLLIPDGRDDESDLEGPATATQSDLVRSRSSVTQDSPAARKRAARIQARIARRPRGVGIWQPNY